MSNNEKEMIELMENICFSIDAWAPDQREIFYAYERKYPEKPKNYFICRDWLLIKTKDLCEMFKDITGTYEKVFSLINMFYKEKIISEIDTFYSLVNLSDYWDGKRDKANYNLHEMFYTYLSGHQTEEFYKFQKEEVEKGRLSKKDYLYTLWINSPGYKYWSKKKMSKSPVGKSEATSVSFWRVLPSI